MSETDLAILASAALFALLAIWLLEKERARDAARRRAEGISGKKRGAVRSLAGGALKKAGTELHKPESAVAAGALLVALAACVSFRLGPLLSIAVLALSAAASFYAVRAWRLKKMRRDFAERFPDAIDSLTRAVQAGIPIEKALAAVGENYDGELGRRFTQLVQHLELGFSFRDASRAFSESLNMPDVNFFCAVLTLNRESGSRLTPMLISLSQMLKNRRSVARKLRTMTAETQSASRILVALPFVVLAAQYFLNPAMFEFLIEDDTGRFILGMCLACMLFGILIIRRMTRTGD